jgi:hypothetical protein
MSAMIPLECARFEVDTGVHRNHDSTMIARTEVDGMASTLPVENKATCLRNAHHLSRSHGR